MSRRRTWALAVTAVVAVVLLVAVPWRPEQPGQTAGGQLSPERAELMPRETLIGLINPKPGGTVLDLGAGFGMFTFPLAQAVGPKGRVVAADTHPGALKYLHQRARKDGADNIVPLRVKAEGVDPAYERYAFDAILASDVLPFIHDHRSFFEGLRPRLDREGGRLWVVELRLDADFTLAEFADAAALRTALRGRGGVLLGRLGEEVRQALAGVDEECLRTQVVAAANRLLDDPALWQEAQAGQWPLSAREAELRHHLASQEQKGPRRLLNRLILQDMLGSDRWERAFALDKFSLESWSLLLASAWHDYPAIFRQAGYELVGEPAGMPYHRVFELRRDR